MDQLMRFPSAVRRDLEVEAWFASPHDEMRRLARPWFELMRGCGEDVRELMHDGCPTACVGDAAFAYVGAYREHVNVGFYWGVALEDPAGLLEGSGRRMRHVKVRWGSEPDGAGLGELISAAYRGMRSRLESTI